MTHQYAIQWPQSSGTLPSEFDCSLKWCHSICQCDDFVSEWAAAHRASELALQFGFPTFVAPPRHCHSRRREGLPSVSFCPLVEVFLGPHDSADMYRAVVHEAAFESHDLPWSDRYEPICRSGPLPVFDFNVDLGCRVEHLLDAFTSADHSISCASEPSALHDDPLSFCKAV